MTDSVMVKTEGAIATVLLNRPAAFNAFDMDLMDRFMAGIVSLAADKNVRAIVISGEGKAFCAGGDLKWALSYPHGPAAGFHELAGRFHLAVTDIRRMAKPVIAAVNGPAAGGGFSLALACDFRVIAESAVLKQAYTSSGLSMDGGGSFTLPRLVGFARALEIAAFDPSISAQQALAWGLATKVVKDGTALSAAMDMARELADKSLHSFGLSKQLLLDSFDSSFETHMERERAALSACAEHPEGKEGLTAFAEKRKPRFGAR
ncbi:MAG: enoyl-CoA hydratase/isomerase family protein [Sulfurifustaceae bacterium]